MIHTIANSAGHVLQAIKYVAGALAVIAAVAGAAQATTPVSGVGVPKIDPSSLLSALTLMIGGVLMMQDTVRQR